MTSKIKYLIFLIMTVGVGACVVSPGYYGDRAPSPYYGYYGYGPSYAWDSGIGIDIGNGWGHGGHYGQRGDDGGHGGGGHGGRGGHR